MYVSYCLELNFVLICLPARSLSQLTAHSHKSRKCHAQSRQLAPLLFACLACCCLPAARRRRAHLSPFIQAGIPWHPRIPDPASRHRHRLGRISHDHSCSFVLYYNLSSCSLYLYFCSLLIYPFSTNFNFKLKLK